MKNNEEKKTPLQGRKLLFRFFVAWVIFMLGTSSVFAQSQAIKGTVTDLQGEPLIGVSVVVKGTSTGTVTDIDGHFSLNAANNATLVFKYVGYLQKEVKVAGTAMTVKMSENAHNLDEVVVVGYGTQRRGDVAGSIASISEKMIEQKQPVDVLQALQGEAAGVQITSVSGAPGAGTSIIIRGASTFGEGGSNPLYVVDGIIMDNIDMINPNDIKSMDILKDAASTAIYGARAANGVVLITTKSGNDGKPKINVRYLNSYGYLANKLPQLNREERDILDNTVQSGRVLTQPFSYFKNATDSVNLQARTSNDYQDIISQTAVRNDINISIAGGSKNLNTYTSLGYLGDRGIILTSYLNRYTGRSKVEYQATNFLKFTTNISGGYEKKNNISEGNTFYNAIRRPTQSILYFPDRSYVTADVSNPSGKRNPLIELYERTNETAKYSGNIYESAELKFLKYFTLVGAATANLYYSANHKYNSPLTNTGAADIAAGKDSGGDETKFYTDILLESYLNYTQSFNKAHNISAVFGVSREADNTTIRTIGDDVYLLKFPEMQVPHGVMLKSSTVLCAYPGAIGSYFGRLSYDYKGKYIFRSNFRRDGSFNFGTKNRWGFFPSFSGAWRISDEKFMDWSRDVLTDAKFRAGWGVTGNDRFGTGKDRYAAYSFYQVSADTKSYNGVPGVYPEENNSGLVKIGNPYLKWEETKQTDIGVDLTFLDGKFVFTGDWYLKRTEALFNDEYLPTESGAGVRKTNVGTVENGGIELSLTAVPIRTKDFTWTTSINWTKNNNKIISLSEGDYIHGDYYSVREGGSAGVFWGYKNLGVYAYDASNAYTADYKTRLTPVFERDNLGNVVIAKSGGPKLIGYKYPDGRDYGWKSDGTGNEIYVLKDKEGNPFKGGDNIWLDYDGDGFIKEGDRHDLATAMSDWYGGWNNTLKYKDFTLNFSLYLNKGGTIYNQLLYDYSRYQDNTSNNDPRAVVQGWRYQGDITDWNIPGQTSSVHPSADNNRKLNSSYLEDGTFLRLQTVRLTYQLKPVLAQKMFLQSMQVYVYGNNLMTWTNYRGYDPEISTSSVLGPNTDNQKYPKKREIGFGFNITL